ncbi:hypothetical protein LAZ67_11001360 [Cordylochernes scorpioides]|uniref:Uncharacterized protein n=1 Tax=Cordylochernes scorpioides TaxID=51811 RepID=A0ABY6L3A0_9ARAC|nr:hypothetical protein LAZ67_11001360 [Cordylochernes scorpioides]
MARVTMDCHQSYRTLQWSATSPDLLPIEHILSVMGNFNELGQERYRPGRGRKRSANTLSRYAANGATVGDTFLTNRWMAEGYSSVKVSKIASWGNAQLYSNGGLSSVVLFNGLTLYTQEEVFRIGDIVGCRVDAQQGLSRLVVAKGVHSRHKPSSFKFL